MVSMKRYFVSTLAIPLLSIILHRITLFFFFSCQKSKEMAQLKKPWANAFQAHTKSYFDGPDSEIRRNNVNEMMGERTEFMPRHANRT